MNREHACDDIPFSFRCVRTPEALEHYVRSRLEDRVSSANHVQWLEVTVDEHSGYGYRALITGYRALITGYRQRGNIVVSHDNGNEFLAVRNACELLSTRLRAKRGADEASADGRTHVPIDERQ